MLNFHVVSCVNFCLKESPLRIARHVLASCERPPTLTCHVHSYYGVGGVLYSRVTWWIRFDSPGVSSGDKPSGRLRLAMESSFFL